MIRRTVALSLGLLVLCRVALAAPLGPPGDTTGGSGPAVTPPAAVTGAPAIDPAVRPTSGAVRAPVALPDAAAAEPGDYRVATALGLAGTYAALVTWMWFSWYADMPLLPEWTFGGDGWMGADTYAGGADKVGHFWANLAFSRLGTDLLRSGGWGRLSSSLVASSLCLATFIFVEVNDGFYTEFSPGDMTANVLGALAALAMSNWPALDDAVDVRLQWFPSAEYRRHPSPNIAEDYSGQTYLLAYKPRSLRAIREGDGAVRWLQFVNPVIGFESRHYKPAPPEGAAAWRRQSLFVGLTIDVQAIFDEALEGRPSTAARWTHGVGHRVFEYFNPPFATLPLGGGSRSPGAPPP